MVSSEIEKEVMKKSWKLSDDEIISMCYDSNFIINIPLLDNKVQNLSQCIDLYFSYYKLLYIFNNKYDDNYRKRPFTF